ncbi:MAG: prolipoprotein diacylglyceryl transferase [Clostridia bacterium]|nr:prolipoprotein diacylglyceryl transferase [Clostridia bacterium]
MKKTFSFLGMEFNTKNSILAVSIFTGIVGILVAIDLTYNAMNWYGFLIGMGFIVAIIFSSKLAKYRGLDKQFPYEIIYFVLPLSIIGARAYYVIFNGVPLFWDAFMIWNGGLAIYGGVIGGAIGGIIYCLIKKQSILSSADVVAPVLILGQAIGRWGNFINKEVYGFVVTDTAWQWFPFAVPIESFGGSVTWHLATFFYESFFDLIGFFLLVFILRRTKKHRGIVGCAYLIYYGIARYFLEGLRIPEYILYLPNTTFPVSQLVSLISIGLGIVGLAIILILNKTKKENLLK